MKLSICQVIRIIKMRIFFYVILKVNMNKMKSKEIKIYWKRQASGCNTTLKLKWLD